MRKFISLLFLILLFLAFYVFLSLNKDEGRQIKAKNPVDESVSGADLLRNFDSTDSSELFKTFGAPIVFPKSIVSGKISSFDFMRAKAALLEIEGEGFKIRAVRPKAAAAKFKQLKLKESSYSLFSMNVYILEENSNFEAFMQGEEVAYFISAKADSREQFIKKLAELNIKKE